MTHHNWWRTRALPALFVIYFAAFGAMLSGMSTRGLQFLSLAVLCLSTAVMWRRTHITRGVLALAAIVFTQAVALIASAPSPEGTSQVILLMVVLVIAWLSTAADIDTLEAAVFAALASAALIALYQALNHWLRVDPFSLPPRLGSTFWNPNSLAFAMLLGIVLAFKHRRWFWLIVFFSALALTGSLTSLVAVLIGLVVYLLLRGVRSLRIRRQHLLVAPVALALGALVVFQMLRRAARNIEFGSMGQRIRLWQVAAEMFSSRPVFGMGPGSFKEIFSRAGLLEAGPTHHHAHNLYLYVAAESGLLGLAALACVLILALLSVWTLWRDGQHRNAALGAALLVTIAVHEMFDYVFWIPAIILLTLWTGRVLFVQSERHVKVHPFSRKGLLKNVRVAQVLLLGMTAFRLASELDFLGARLAQYTTALSLFLAILLVLTLPSGFEVPALQWPVPEMPARLLQHEERPPSGKVHPSPE